MSHYEGHDFREFQQYRYMQYILKPNPAPAPFFRSYEGEYFVKIENVKPAYHRIISMEG